MNSSSFNLNHFTLSRNEGRLKNRRRKDMELKEDELKRQLIEMMNQPLDNEAGLIEYNS